ncbi:MAG: hypothetical protein LBL69_01010 [Zoogloeaceae bacterium]|jgi:hypothetical protein|nr:hypothetical protein [Zoogloeaceae bacterium]
MSVRIFLFAFLFASAAWLGWHLRDTHPLPAFSDMLALAERLGEDSTWRCRDERTGQFVYTDQRQRYSDCRLKAIQEATPMPAPPAAPVVVEPALPLADADADLLAASRAQTHRFIVLEAIECRLSGKNCREIPSPAPANR